MKYLKKYNESFSIEKNDNVKACVDEILDYMNDNGMNQWDEIYLHSKYRTDINNIMDNYVDNMNDVNDIKFWILVETCEDKDELLKLLSELERDEKYERCAIVKKRLESL